MHASVGRITPATLPEVGRYTVKLSPADCHPGAIGRVNRDRTFVRSVAKDVISILIHVCLVAEEAAKPRNHSRRGLDPVDVRSRRVIVFFQWLFGVWVPCRRHLSGTRGNGHDRDEHSS